MGNRSGPTNTETWERPNESNCTPPSCRENYANWIAPPCGRVQFTYPRATWLPTQSIDISPTLKRGGDDKIGFYEAKIDRCGFPGHTKSFRPSLERRTNFQTN
ncbi:hypothetical protein TNCV_157401 [Trichonephila clavipes]|nr:hypothetical protein TNCV_157401 [Trichonephila clavipes]